MEEGGRKRRSRFDLLDRSNLEQTLEEEEEEGIHHNDEQQKLVDFAKSFLLPSAQHALLAKSLSSSIYPVSSSSSYISVTDPAFKAKLERAMEKNLAYLEKYASSIIVFHITHDVISSCDHVGRIA